MSRNQRISQQAGAVPPPVSPAATGGEGTVFEQHVSAFFLGLLLTKGVPPCFVDACVSEVRLQTRNDGWFTDDILVMVQDASGTIRNLAIQVKLDVSITASKSNDECRDVISGAWRDFNNRDLFTRDRDLVAVAVSRGTQALLGDFRRLLNCAAACRTSELFSQRIATQGHLSAKSREQYDAICQIIRATDSGEVQDAEIWQFLRCFRVLFFDFDPSASQAEANVKNLLALLATEEDPVSCAGASWQELLAVCAEGMPRSASYAYDDLPKEVRDRHRTIGPQERGPLRHLLDHGELVLGRISTVVGDGVSIDRADLVSTVLQRLDSLNSVVVTGPAGSGKSAVARQALGVISEHGYVFAFRAEEFATAHLDDTLNRAQVPFQAAELFRLLSSHDRKVLLVESVERLLEKPERDSFVDLLRLIAADSSWQLILTCREYSLDVFCSAFLEQVGAGYEVVRIPPLNDQELGAVALEIPGLKRPLTNQRLCDLLRNPYLLAMATKIPWAEPDSLPTDERAFRLRVWSEVVRKESYTQHGQPTRRGETFKELAVRRARALIPFVPCDDLDRQVLDGLRTDGLIEYSSNTGLAAAPAHDVLEDWAILQWIDDTYDLRGGDSGAFVSTLGSHPAIRRAYRHWLNDFLHTRPDSALALVTGVFFNDGVSPQIRDDTLVSMMLSEHAANFLRQSREVVIADKCRLLVRLIHLVRVACMGPPSWLSGVRGAALSVFLLPKGPSWPVILELAADNLNDLLSERAGVVLGLLKDWAKAVRIDIPDPAGAPYAGAIAATLLAHYEKGGYSFEEQVKQILETILKIPGSCEAQFESLIDRACTDDRRDHTADRFSEMLLQDLHSSFACRDFPDQVIRLANAHWKPRPPKHDGRYDLYSHLELADVFGLSHHVEHGYFPASAWHGPFMPLLRSHPKAGLEFIIDLLNHSVESYATNTRRQIEPPWEVSFSLADGAAGKQWCNDRLWCLYRGSSVGPYLLQTALMALEAWLLEECERDHEISEVLDLILTRSNNAALSAVVASVAVAHPEKAGASALPLLGCRDFVQLDIGRMVKDLWPVTATLNAVMPVHPSRQLYNEERMKSDSLPHRRLHMKSLAIELQAGPLKAKVQRIIDQHHRVLPPLEEQSDTDRIWRLALHRMDLRKYEVKGRLEDGRVVIQAGAPEPDLQKAVDKNAEEQVPIQTGLRLLTWGNTVFRGDEEARGLREQWREHLETALGTVIPSGETVDPTLARITGGGISFVAAVCVRDHWDDMDESQQEWSIDILVKAVIENADSDDYAFVVGRNATDAARPAAAILSLILCKPLRSEIRERVEAAIFVALTHACYEVVDYAAEGTGAFLWDGDAGLAKKCAALCIRRAELASAADEANRAKPFGEGVSYEEVCRGANMQARKQAKEMAAIDAEQLLSLDIDNPHHQREVHLLLGILGHQASGELGEAFMKRLGQLLVQAWSDRETRRGIDRPHANYELEYACIHRIARFCLELPADAALVVAEPILDALDELPEHVADFVTDLVAEEDRRRSGDTFWHLWQAAADKALAARWVRNLDDRYSHGKKLVDALFLSGPWKDNVRHWEPLEDGWRRMDQLFNGLPATVTVFEAYLRYLFHVGERSLPEALSHVERKLTGGASLEVLSAPDVAFCLDSVLRRFVYGKPFQLKSNMQLRESILRLLDGMVEAGSSSAYLMRDDFVTPLSLTINVRDTTLRN